MLPAHRTPTTQGRLGKLASQRTVSILLAINQPPSAANKPSVQRGGNSFWLSSALTSHPGSGFLGTVTSGLLYRQSWTLDTHVELAG